MLIPIAYHTILLIVIVECTPSTDGKRGLPTVLCGAGSFIHFIFSA